MPIENGVVRTPEGFKEAYKTFAETGWCGIACDPKYGGQGLPKVVNFVFEEMICSANMSFGMYPGLSMGAYNAIEHHATDELKDTYLPKLVDGSWSGTMCLTEPHCGTDLGLIRTKAVPGDDGSYKITGTKIFISAGEHDLTENIVHLVLAKLPDAPEGVRGISLFLVPKFLPKQENGALRPSRARATASCAARSSTRWASRRQVDLRHQLRGGQGVAGRPAAQGHGAYVHDDERGAARRRHPGSRRRRGRLSERGRFTPRERIQGRAPERRRSARQGRRSDHRSSRRAAHAACAPSSRDRRSARASPTGPGLEIDKMLKHPDPEAVRAEGSRLDRAHDADHQGLLHRSRLRGGEPRGPGLWRPRLSSPSTASSSSCATRASRSSMRAPTASRRST